MTAVPPAPPAALIEGVDLFNQGRWFEAHEVLEAAWLAEPGPDRRLYQGLLQVGVGLHHARRGNLAGALRLLERGMGLLRPFSPHRLGLDVAALLAASSAARDRLAAPGGLEGFDWAQAPRARFVGGAVETRESG